MMLWLMLHSFHPSSIHHYISKQQAECLLTWPFPHAAAAWNGSDSVRHSEAKASLLGKLSESNFGLSAAKDNLAMCQNLVPLVNIKIAGKWMFIPLKMVLIGIDPYPFLSNYA